jgi:hypothetical protein
VGSQVHAHLGYTSQLVIETNMIAVTVSTELHVHAGVPDEEKDRREDNLGKENVNPREATVAMHEPRRRRRGGRGHGG